MSYFKIELPAGFRPLLSDSMWIVGHDGDLATGCVFGSAGAVSFRLTCRLHVIFSKPVSTPDVRAEIEQAIVTAFHLKLDHRNEQREEDRQFAVTHYHRQNARRAARLAPKVGA